MKKGLSFLMLVFLGMTPSVVLAEPQDSVVKIFVTTNHIDYSRPWQTQGSSAASGSGFVVKGNKILTNAHVVNDSTFIQIRKESNPKKYSARVEAVGQDCDLALLTVDDPEFFQNVPALDFGELPKLQDSVTVVGFPLGGDKLSVTKGVVSRIEIVPYTQSAKKLLAVQIDAAINPGNSGGPVFQSGKVVGVAMQVISESQNIGYMIPVPIINHFFKDLVDGKYSGFPTLGIEFFSTENHAIKKYFHSPKDSGGVLVSWIAPYSSAEGTLLPNDVLLSIDNVPIGEDGTFEFRPGERLALVHLVTSKQIGEEIETKVLRAGILKTMKFKLIPYVNLVPFPHEFDEPPYLIYGGLVFSQLSVDLLASRGSEWWKESPINFLQYLFGTERLNVNRKKQIVVLLEVLPDDVNVGYHSYRDEVIRYVNGQEFSSFEEFVKLIQKNNDKFIVFETDQKDKIILDTTDIQIKNKSILERYHISSQFSDDIKIILGKNI